MERRLVNANKETTMNDAPRTEAMLTRIQGFDSGRVDDKALVSVKAILVVASGLCADLERELAEQKQARKELADELEDWRTATGRDTHLEVFDLLGRLRSRISDLSREVIELTAKQGHARGDSVAEPQQISASDEPSPAAYYPWGIDTPQPGGGSV
jgi:hypothetical protein